MPDLRDELKGAPWFPEAALLQSTMSPDYVDNLLYGGVQASARGRERIRFAMKEMSEIKNLFIRRVWHAVS